MSGDVIDFGRARQRRDELLALSQQSLGIGLSVPTSGGTISMEPMVTGGRVFVSSGMEFRVTVGGAHESS